MLSGPCGPRQKLEISRTQLHCQSRSREPRTHAPGRGRTLRGMRWEPGVSEALRGLRQGARAHSGRKPRARFPRARKAPDTFPGQPQCPEPVPSPGMTGWGGGRWESGRGRSLGPLLGDAPSAGCRKRSVQEHPTHCPIWSGGRRGAFREEVPSQTGGSGLLLGRCHRRRNKKTLAGPAKQEVLISFRQDTGFTWQRLVPWK